MKKLVKDVSSIKRHIKIFNIQLKEINFLNLDFFQMIMKIRIDFQEFLNRIKNAKH